MNTLEITTRSPEETQELGKQLGKLAQPGDIYLLSGQLGAGKTCLTQGIAWGLGSTEYAASPTFVLMRELKGRLMLYHIDLYRLDHLEEIADLGLDDYFYGKGVCVVEWAEKGLAILPEENLLAQIHYLNDKERRFILTPNGKRYDELLQQIQAVREERR
ncbi:MAG: tRNA (adenosine(37)-N6)-threonylcarbamoyltransferase complex ATPase subunit type 1 TsaE [Dehalococcoidales bacterium]|nr:tRNA (adenosine(37)-N6)-threonylcarbamoyltransferase complex ATPase subunit type 1 TsaE [Dehalococcoidales bacterium]